MRVLGVDGGQSGIRLRHSSGDRIVEVVGVSRQEGDTVARSRPRPSRTRWRRLRFRAHRSRGPGSEHGTHRPETPARRLCALVGRATRCGRGLARRRRRHQPRRRAVPGLGRERGGGHGRGVPGRPGARRRDASSAGTATSWVMRAAPSGSAGRACVRCCARSMVAGLPTALSDAAASRDSTASTTWVTGCTARVGRSTTSPSSRPRCSPSRTRGLPRRGRREWGRG